MHPAVHEDGAAPLGTVSDAQSIDARRVAPEVARVWIGEERTVTATPTVTPASTETAIGGRKKRGASRHTALCCRPKSERFRSCGEFHTLRQHRNGCSFERAHEAWLLQQLREVGVLSGIPADDGLQRQPIHLLRVDAAVECIPGNTIRTPASVSPCRIIRIGS